MAQPANDVRALEERLGVSFLDPGLLQRALVHRSYLNENPGMPLVSNERLEFLGDAVLGLAVARWLFRETPDATEGQLTRARAALVRRETLAAVAQGLDLGACLLLGKGEESGGGRQRRANLANALEALVGAVYLDQGEGPVLRLVERLLGPALARYRADETGQDAKSRLQELLQGTLKKAPVYRVVEEEGPEHERRFSVEVLLGDSPLGRGTGRSKRDAETAAAQAALERLQAGPSLPPP